MPRFGGQTPFPMRFGGAGPYGVRIKSILDGLNRARGSAYDTTATSNVYAENNATARVIADVFGVNQRLANQFDATRMTTNLSRWEKILNIIPAPTDSDTTRRARIASLFSRTGLSPFTSFLVPQLAALLGSVFVAVEFISYSNAVIHVPDGTYPWGTVAIGSPWSSTTAHLLVRVTSAGITEAAFQNSVGLIASLLDATLPAWATYDWYRAPQTGAPIAVTGGPSAAGFYLDERNLDNEVFDI